jgi:hypothetical protein
MLALMPTTHDHAAWFVLRIVAGAASALVFMFAVSAMLSHLQRVHHLVGWGFDAVGRVVVVGRGRDPTFWSHVAPHTTRAGRSGDCVTEADGVPPVHRWFAALFAAYSLEGVGYIIAGTFLVAAIDHKPSGWASTGTWILVGICALPASAIWAALGRRWTRPSLLVAALFGSTFLGIGLLVLTLGAHLQFPRAIALLTTGYSVGQVLGPCSSHPELVEAEPDPPTTSRAQNQAPRRVAAYAY